MKGFFGKRREKLFDLEKLDFDRLALYVLPRFFMEIARKYLRLEVEGTKNIPQRGKAIVIPNHSGWVGLDAVMIGNEIFKSCRRIPRVLAHPGFFSFGEIKIIAEKMGLQKATTENAIKLLKKNNLTVLFPEGEAGNFKPTAERYKLREFRRGFVRMAMITGAPIVPTVVIGAEEANINLGQLKFTKYLKGQIIPLPLNFLPLPSRWKIKFLKPIKLEGYTPKDAADTELVHNIAVKVQKRMQTAINRELRNRNGIYFNAESRA